MERSAKIDYPQDARPRELARIEVERNSEGRLREGRKDPVCLESELREEKGDSGRLDLSRGETLATRLGFLDRTSWRAGSSSSSGPPLRTLTHGGWLPKPCQPRAGRLFQARLGRSLVARKCSEAQAGADSWC